MLIWIDVHDLLLHENMTLKGRYMMLFWLKKKSKAKVCMYNMTWIWILKTVGKDTLNRLLPFYVIVNYLACLMRIGNFVIWKSKFEEGGGRSGDRTVGSHAWKVQWSMRTQVAVGRWELQICICVFAKRFCNKNMHFLVYKKVIYVFEINVLWYF